MNNKLEDLNITEKITLLTGHDNWEIHNIDKLDKVHMSDGPCGLRLVQKEVINDSTGAPQVRIKVVPKICFASPSVLANSWNKEVVKKTASAIADECIESEIDMLLAPGINIKRDPRCGRNFEYFSEDPLLAGTLAKEYIDGLQEKGIGSSLKHYCANNSEDNRQTLNVVVDKRTLMEIYTRNFYYACKANPTSVMCSYNRINGFWASENNENNDILYNKLGFKGAIISDWGAVHNKLLSVKSGLALQMPHHPKMFEKVKTALDNGEITEQEIDVCAGRTVDLINRIQQMKVLRKVGTSKQERSLVAEEGAIEGIVLLKNDKGLLPIKRGSKVGFAGSFTNSMYCGGGSARIETPNRPESLLRTMPKYDSTMKAIDGTYFCTTRQNGHWHYPWTAWEDMLAKFNGIDYAIVQAGTGHEIETEGNDRQTIRLEPSIEAHIRLVADNFKGKTIVVLYAGSAIDCSSWIDKVDAVVYAGFGGEGVNRALSKILLGEVSPSGKLAETFPKRLEDISCLNTYNEYMTEDYYTDRIFVGYRHYDKNKIKPRFEFGFGLSYAKFDYSNLVVLDEGKNLLVKYSITNSSNVDAKEVSQVYAFAPGKAAERSVKDLIGYRKDFIKAGETVNVSLEIDKERLCYYNVDLGDFVLEKGCYKIAVGASSRDLRLKTKIKLK